ncbi:MAG: threonine synthase [Gemmataceae bacterium]
MNDAVFLRCIRPECRTTQDLGQTAFTCPRCGGLMDVCYDRTRLPAPSSWQFVESKWSRRTEPLCFSGVWRFHELLPFAPPEKLVTIGEGQTLLQRADAVAAYVNLSPGRLFLQYEGMNPSGSFKDNGMCAAFSHANLVGAKRAACASTGNTSASLAAYCSVTGKMRAIIFIGSGKISYGKLSQALDYGALTVQIQGDFDDAMRRVQQVASRLGIYLVNSINPFRLEGQKTVMYRILEALGWQVPDWIVVPGGNLGNISAFGKAFHELHQLGLVPRMPRFAVINAAGANTLHVLMRHLGLQWNAGRPDEAILQRYYAELDATGRKADTLASAIEINRPVNLPKALRALACSGGAVREVTDQEIMDAKARIGAGGLGCEPASAASVAGLRRLREEGVINRDERVVCVLTGHQLKDPNATVAYHTHEQAVFEEYLGRRGVKQAPFANRAVLVPNDLEAIVQAIETAV